MGLFNTKSAKPTGSDVQQQPASKQKGSSNNNANLVVQQPSSSQAPPGAAAQYRPIFLLVWPSPLFKAHWAIFIPEAGDNTFKKGKYVHVEGHLREGFHFGIVRGWDLTLTNRRPKPAIEIGWIRSDLVVDTPADGSLIKDATPCDQLETFLAAVPAPGQSLNSVSSGGSSSGKNVELSDGQWWTTRCIHALVENGHLVPPAKGLNKNKDPRDVVAGAPRH
ncbi:hypothetical protein BST61_g1840 [Cercospora zeina]